ncbi:MAG TPA: DUF3540 domain-containing protein [Polyangiaceae bacterium]|nr:DUF3540 domain-containing protein [Polyangiaceae bacterium]
MTTPLSLIQGGRANDAMAEAAASGAFVFGPARTVSAASGGFVDVELVGREEPRARAALAFAQPYEPAEGDILLCAGPPGDLYAIGVLRGNGRAVLHVEGDLDVRASGKLRLAGARGVEIAGPELDLAAEKLRVVARAATHTFQSLVERVTGLLSTQAKTMHTKVDEGTVTHAKSATILTEENVVVNGKQLFFG